MIKVSRVEKSFGRRKILNGLSFELQPGITGLAGPNACGKTTLVKCILGLLIPEQGQISVAGESTTGDWKYRRSIGYMPQYPDFPSNLTFSELLHMLEDLRGQESPRKKELLEYFDLSQFIRRPFGQLSGGTKQKVGAVIAFMFDAPVMVLDEPTAGLDPLSTVRFKDLLSQEASSGKTILLVSHIMTEMDQLAHELIYLAEGIPAFHGSIQQLKQNESEPLLERAITSLLFGKAKKTIGDAR